MSRGKRMRAPEVVRRSRTRRLDVTTVLAVVIPLVTVGLLALVRIPPVHDTDQPPSLTKLTNALVVCPSGRPGSTDAAVSTASGASGDLSVLAGGQQQSVAGDHRRHLARRQPGRARGPRLRRAGSGAGRAPVRERAARRPRLHGAVAGAVVHRCRRDGPTTTR